MLRSAPTRTAELQAMLEDIQQALKKPVNQRSWIMVINTKKCSGCQSCAVACMAENMSPPSGRRALPIKKETGPFFRDGSPLPSHPAAGGNRAGLRIAPETVGSTPSQWDEAVRRAGRILAKTIPVRNGGVETRQPLASIGHPEPTFRRRRY